MLFVLGAEGAVFLNVAGTFAVFEDDVAAVALHHRHGSPASRDPNRRARAGKVGRVDGRYNTSGVDNSKLRLLEVECNGRSLNWMGLTPERWCCTRG